MSAALIAIDWGTTNRRIFVMDAAGKVLHSERDALGLLAVPQGQFSEEVAAIRRRHGDIIMLLAGMVGSAKGWVNVPYLQCPASIRDLGTALHWVEPGRTAIVPGIADPAGDVMRGEEVQFLGAVSAGLVPEDTLLCQPGTHCKWARMTEGLIASFSTSMTGELFSLLKQHSLLSDFLAGEVSDGDPFQQGVRDALHGQLTSQLFRVRASALLGKRSAQDSAAYTSGLLIGHDVAGQAIACDQQVHILADPHLGQLYARAVSIAAGQPLFIDSNDAFVAGIYQIWKVRP